MALIFIVCLLLWGWVEISVFIFVSAKVGVLLTLLGIFLTAIIGIALLKNQGLSVLNRVHVDLGKGHPPVVSIADSVSLVLGGGLMLIPGYASDGLGLLLFIPGFRTIAGMYLLRWITEKPNFVNFRNFGGIAFTRAQGNPEPFGFGEQSHRRSDFDDVIEGEFEERADTKSHLEQQKKGHQNNS